jgi:hypothetical protein
MPWLTRLSRKPTAAARASGSGPDGPATLRHSSPANTPASTLDLGPVFGQPFGVIPAKALED